MTEFATAAELFAHYAAVRARVRAWKSPAKPEPKPVPKPKPPPRKPLPPGKVHAVIRLVSEDWPIKACALTGKSRSRPVYVPRAVVMYLAHTLGLASTTIIGKALGDRDHTTVINAIKNVRAWRAEEPWLDEKLALLEHRLIEELQL